MATEHQQLLAELYSKDDDNLYQTLMAKEQDVLDVVNRVSNQAREKDAKSEEFVNLPLVMVVQGFYTAMYAIAQDLQHATRYRDIAAALTKGDRGIYVGLLLVLTALFMLLVRWGL